MTLAMSRGSEVEASGALADRDLRRGLTALLQRRLPTQEVEDIAQTVLCDALAARALPSDPDELRRYVSGIARHKIADYHRRAARQAARTTDEDPADLGAPQREEAFGERAALERLLAEPRTRRDAQTLEWLVREHGGDRLNDIAKEEGLSSAVVRQRVSRLRRALRARYAALVLAVVVLVGLALGRVLGPELLGAPAPAITPERAPVAPREEDGETKLAPAIPLDMLGDWAVENVRPAAPLSANEQRILDLERRRAATLHVAEDRLVLDTARLRLAWSIRAVTVTPSGLRLTLAPEAGGEPFQAELVRAGRGRRGSSLELRGASATVLGRTYAGSLVLRRQVF